MKFSKMKFGVIAAAAALVAACGGTAMNTSTNNSMSNARSNTNSNMAVANTNTTANSNSAEAKDIVAVASGSAQHTTLVAAVKAADLVGTLSGPGPFTVFAPTNAAFEKLPAGTVDTLLKPENKSQLTAILTYHVVPGKLDAAAVTKAIEDGNGKATVKTVQGEELTAAVEGGSVVLTDAKGNKSKVTTTDLMASNGVIHVIDAVVQPK